MYWTDCNYVVYGMDCMADNNRKERPMVNHWFDRDVNMTRCREYAGITAEAVSANERVSCPDCYRYLDADERAIQWYGRTS